MSLLPLLSLITSVKVKPIDKAQHIDMEKITLILCLCADGNWR